MLVVNRFFLDPLVRFNRHISLSVAGEDDIKFFFLIKVYLYSKKFMIGDGVRN